jgi:hypothetical protein
MSRSYPLGRLRVLALAILLKPRAKLVPHLPFVRGGSDAALI